MVVRYFLKFALDVYAKRKKLRQTKKITPNAKHKTFQSKIRFRILYQLKFCVRRKRETKIITGNKKLTHKNFVLWYFSIFQSLRQTYTPNEKILRKTKKITSNDKNYENEKIFAKQKTFQPKTVSGYFSTCSSLRQTYTGKKISRQGQIFTPKSVSGLFARGVGSECHL